LQQYIHFTFVTATARSITKVAGMTPSTRELPGMIPQGDDSLGSDGLGAAHQEHWPMAIHSR
jgi:hypothetical protein